MSPYASAPTVVLPSRTAPASCSRVHDVGVTLWDAALERLRTPAGDQASGVEQVLHTIGNAVERATPDARRSERIHSVGLPKCQLGRDPPRSNTGGG